MKYINKLTLALMLFMILAPSVKAEESEYGSKGQVTFTGEYQVDNGPDEEKPHHLPQTGQPHYLPQTGEQTHAYQFMGINLVVISFFGYLRYKQKEV
ncbi:LPXTG cell wall anchor domain-containing protein [Vagococcus zengguangii]|uniref:LPXTG cell wall anchor domain-containing protein n=1 Tax=Vagococcus zengguangii TaxID=2571750 RepID=A0A4D7CQ55_9ENTE|nr:LPXTG cell wall anchor domain-containing protein [Vagococcus zengguangii]QCI86285.1 LPXTG cell wall anchor domain-containing protein [Vagococcus zengguangii]QCI86721.1 LPXTG cell wall anchor domain-containing protein [Vagococcus zengguangii]TLG78277.1 LPXTG cell wall anchor domain-containing protein [Vagococcus zengguangii]